MLVSILLKVHEIIVCSTPAKKGWWVKESFTASQLSPHTQHVHLLMHMPKPWIVHDGVTLQEVIITFLWSLYQIFVFL